jgi:hypothetical protein
VRVAGFLPRSGQRPGHQRGQLAGRVHRPAALGLDDRPGHAGGVPLLAVVPDDLRQLLFIYTGQEVGGRLAHGGVHPHVERAVVPERKPALRAIELGRRDAEIDQEAVHRDHPQPVEHLAGLRKAGVHQRDPIAERFQQTARHFQRVRIAIHSDETSIGRRTFEHQTGVSAHAQGEVAISAARFRVEPGEHLFGQNWQVCRSLMTRLVVSFGGGGHHERSIVGLVAGVSSFAAKYPA